jgi:hypothetical protein
MAGLVSEYNNVKQKGRGIYGTVCRKVYRKNKRYGIQGIIWHFASGVCSVVDILIYLSQFLISSEFTYSLFDKIEIPSIPKPF